MTKPVDMEEMLLRIRALLRRAQIVSERKFRIGEVTLLYDSLTVVRGEDRQTLPQKEFYLLYKLLSYPDKIFTRIQLMDEIWGMESDSADTTVNVHINRLRRRFEDYPEFELVAVRGLGYKAVKESMIRRKINRFRLGLLFSLIVMLIFLITGFLMVMIGAVIIHFGVMGKFGLHMTFPVLLAAMVSSVIVGTAVSLFVGSHPPAADPRGDRRDQPAGCR